MKSHAPMKITLVVALAMCLLSVFSCSQPTVSPDTGTQAEMVAVIPYAEEAKLNEWAGTEDMTDWKLMRLIAVADLLELGENMGFTVSDRLSEYPVAVMDPSDGRPAYYEFQILRDYENIGYITTAARSGDGDPVQFISDQPRDWSEAETEKALAAGKNVYASSYPFVVFASPEETKNLEPVNDIPEGMTSEEYITKIAEAIPDEEFAEMGLSREDYIADCIAKQKEEDERTQQLWEALEAEADKILNMSEEDIRKAFEESEEKSVSQGTQHAYGAEWKYTILDRWKNKHFYMNGDVLTTYCCPMAETMLLSGLENGTYVYGSTFAKTMKRLIDAGLKSEGPVAPWKAAEPFNKASDKYSMRGSYIWDGSVAGDLKANDLPVLILRTGTIDLWKVLTLDFDGLYSDASFHYRLCVGEATKSYSQKHRFLWWSWTEWRTEQWRFMYDNYADASREMNNGISIGGASTTDGSGYQYWERTGSKGLDFWKGVVYKK